MLVIYCAPNREMMDFHVTLSPQKVVQENISLIRPQIHERLIKLQIRSWIHIYTHLSSFACLELDLIHMDWSAILHGKVLKACMQGQTCRIDCVCNELSNCQSSQRRSLIFAHNGVGPGILQCTHAQYWIREMMETQSHHTIHVTWVPLCHLMRHERSGRTPLPWPLQTKAPPECNQVPEF